MWTWALLGRKWVIFFFNVTIWIMGPIQTDEADDYARGGGASIL